MLKIVEQNIGEARASFTKTLQRMAGGEKIALVVRKRHGQPQAVLIPAPEAAAYFRWITEQLDAHLVEEAQGSSQSELNLSLPEG